MSSLVEALREAAGKATPGPWRAEGSIYTHMSADVVAKRGLAQFWAKSNGWHDASFVALCSPDNILALLDELAALTARAEQAERGLDAAREGIQAYLDGDYDHPRRHRPGQCRHGVYYYEECGSCTDEHFAQVLAGVRALQSPPAPSEEAGQ